MKHIFSSAFVLLALTSTVLNAQDDVKISKSHFKAGKSGFEDAWKHVSKGDDYYKEKGVWYGYAFDEYLKAIVYNNSNAELNYKTGVSALFSDNKEEAAGFLLKASELKNDVADDILLLTGRALQFSGRYAEAIEKLQSYLNSTGKNKAGKITMANKWIDECNSARNITNDTLRVTIKNLGENINSASDDYSDVFSSDEKNLYFASRRELPKSGKRYSDTKFDENIFISQKTDSVWSLAIPAGKDLLTKFCETPISISKEGDRLFIYAGYENNGDIKVSEKDKKGNWKTPELLNYPVNSNYSETSFSISPSGNEIYFVSDNPKDSYGGKDIFFIRKIKEKKWSKPQNLGSNINTAYDEESVRLSKTGDTLWFSSKGHNTIGGFDIFYCKKNLTGEWDTVRNIGYPVNTPWDELFYNQSNIDDSLFYFVSNRNGSLGGLDIYMGRILPPKPVIVIPQSVPKTDTVVIRDTVVIKKDFTPPPPPVVVPEPVKEVVLYLSGKITDSETGSPVMAKIDVLDIKADTVITTTASSDIDGSYKVILPEKKSYKIDLKATGYLSDSKRIDVPDNWPRDVYNLNLDLIKVKVGKKVVLNNILFGSGNAILTEGSSAELAKLVNIMNENSQMKIEISGHTDKTGSEPVNLKLSENRAKAVVDFLIKNGIDKTRMEYKGFGSSQPVAENNTSQGRAKNRRVEFKILEF